MKELERELDELLIAYYLGDKLRDLKFMDVVMDGLIEAFLLRFPTHRVDAVYSHTPATSPLRRLFVHAFVFSGEANWIIKHKEKYPREFLYDLSMAFITEKPKGAILCTDAPYKKNSCDYHQHKGTDKACYKTKRV